MAQVNRVADMTIDELQDFVGRMIDARLGIRPGQPQRIGQATPEVWQALLNGIIEPIAGQPTVLELLQEERDLWYRNT